MSKEQKQSKKKVTTNKRSVIQRYLLIVLAVLLFTAAIVYKMVQLTVVQADAWNAKANEILTRVEPIAAERGKILADDGTVLAANMYFYKARIDWLAEAVKRDTVPVLLPALADSMAAFDPSRTKEQWLQYLSESFTRITREGDARKMGHKQGLTKQQMDSMGWPRSNHAFPLLRRQLTHNEFNRLKTFPLFSLYPRAGLLHADKEYKRCKPYGSMASRSIGTVREENRTVVGKQGLEASLDSLLGGTPGRSKKIQVTYNIISAVDVPPVDGYDITTTINVGMQDIVENELYKMCHETGAEWGTAVLMEVATGEIKAISNLALDPRISDDYIEGSNNAVLGFEPGSVMKPISMMVALEDGITVGGIPVSNIDQPIPTGSTWTYAGSVIRDPHGGVALSPRQIIETSSNIGMSKIITSKYNANPDGFRQRLVEMGFFEPLNCGISSARTPSFPKLGDKIWDRVALSRMSFGYTTEIPPLCTLAIYNAIANDGKYVRPRLIKKLSREGMPDSIVPTTMIRKQVCSPENARKLRIMLHDVVWGSRGTARKWLQDDRVHIAGKTGTAYNIEPGTNSYGSRKRLAFCGFFPYENPKYSCIVLMLGANRGAAASSGMVLKNVALRMYARGMLGDNPTYERTDGTKAADNRPTTYASLRTDVNKTLVKGLAAAGSRHITTPQQPAGKGTVPNVVGLSAREAVARLEQAGLVATIRGRGSVTGQSVAPGTPVERGQLVTLTLGI